MNLKYPLYKYAATILVTLTLSCQMLFVPAMAGQEEESSLNLNAQSAVLMDASTAGALRERGGSDPPHGQHHQDHDLYSGFGEV